MHAGDGGNVEGLSRAFIDTSPEPYCNDTSLYPASFPSYQPLDQAAPVISLQNGSFCPTEQPAWSAFRDQAFGHGTLRSMLPRAFILDCFRYAPLMSR